MKKFLIAIAAIGFINLPVMADDHEEPRSERRQNPERRENTECAEGCAPRRSRGRRGFTFNYYRPSQVFGGIGNYGVGVSARIGGGMLDIVTAPFVTAPVMGPPQTYIYHPSTIQYTPPLVRRIYPRRHRGWHRH